MAVALHDTCLVVIDSGRLQKQLAKIDDEEYRERAKCLDELQYLSVMSFAQRKRICKNSFYKTYCRN